MKQTNNALTFLMAQYRAIFKNAYFKGIASAMVMTAGLAAAQGVQASAGDAFDGDAWSGSSVATAITITGDNTTDPGTEKTNYAKLAIIADSEAVATTNTTITIKGGAAGTNKIEASGNSVAVTMANGAAVNIVIEAAGTNTAENTGLAINAVDNNASLTVTDFTINKGTLQLSGADATGTATLNATKFALKADGNLDLTGNTTVKGGEFDANGTINATGTGNLIDVSTAGGTFGEGSQINVATGGALAIKGHATNGTTFSGSEVNVSGTLALGSGSNSKFDFNDATTTVAAGGTLDINSGSVTVNSGSLTFGENSYLNITSGSLTVKNATVDLKNAVISGNSTNPNNNKITADSGATIELKENWFEEDAAEAIYGASNGGKLTATKLSIAGSNFVTNGSAAGINIGSGGSLELDELELTGTSNSAAIDANGIVVVKNKISSSGDAFTAGTLQLGDSEGSTQSGKIASDLTVKNTTNVLGTWASDADKGVTVDAAGRLNIGSEEVSGSLTTKSVTFTGANTGIMVNARSALTVTGDVAATAKLGTTAAENTIGLADTAELNVDGTLSISADAASATTVKAAITTSKLDLGAKLEKLTLADVTVSKELKNSHASEDITLSSTIKLDNNDPKAAGTIVATTADKGFIISGEAGGLDITGKWESTANITVDGTAFGLNGADLTIKGATLALQNEGATVAPPTEGVSNKLTISGGALSVKDTSISLKEVDLKLVESTVSVTATDEDAPATLTLKEYDKKNLYEAKANGVLEFGSLTADVGDFKNAAATKGIKVEANGTLKASELILTGSGDAAIAGTVKVTDSISAKKDIAFTGGTLQLDSTKNESGVANGTIEGNLLVKTTNDILGIWDVVDGKKVSIYSNGTLNVGSDDVSGMLTTGALEFASDSTGDINIFADSFLNVRGSLETAASTFKTQSGTGSDIIVQEGGTLAVDSLSLTGTGNATIAGTVQVNQSLNAAEDISFAGGILQLGATGDLTTTDGTIGNNLKVTNTTNVFGDWSLAKGKDVTVAGGKLTVGSESDTGSLTTAGLTVDNSALTVNNGSNLTATTITATGDSINFNGEGTLTVIGQKPATSTTPEPPVTPDPAETPELQASTGPAAGTDGYYGFALDGKTVNVNGGTFVIGSIATEGLLNDKYWKKDADLTEADKEFNKTQEYVHNNFGVYSLSSAGTLKVSFDSKTEFTIAEYNQLKQELFGTDGLTGGTFDIGAATITGLTGDNSVVDTSDPKNPTLTYDDYVEYKDKTDNIFAGLKDEVIAATQLTGVDGAVDSLNIGSIALAENGEVTFTGTSSLNAAKEGNLISDADGEAGDATLANKSILSLRDSGDVASVYLTEGTAKYETTLNIDDKNNLESVKAIAGDPNNGFSLLEHTKVVVGSKGFEDAAEAVVNGVIQVSTLENNGKLTVAADEDAIADGTSSLWTKTVNNNGDLTVAAGDVVTEKSFNNAGTFAISDGKLTAEDALSNAGTLTVAQGINVGGDFTNAGEASAVSVTTGNVETTGKLTNEGNLTLASGSVIAHDALSNAGSINVASGDIVALDTFSNAGSMVVTKGAVSASDTLLNDGTLTVAQGVAAQDTLTNNGTLTVSAGSLDGNGDFDPDNGSNAIVAQDSLVNAGDLRVASGNVLVAEDLSNAAEKAFTVDKGDVEIGGALSNEGTLTVTAGELDVNESFVAKEGSTTTAKSIYIDSRDNDVYQPNAVSTTIAGTVNVTNTNANTDIASNDYATALDNPENVDFSLNSHLKDSRGNIIKAVISGEVNVNNATAGLVHTNLTSGGRVNANNALLGEDVVIGAGATFNANRTIIGYTEYARNTSTEEGATEYIPSSSHAGDVLVNGTANLGDLRFINGSRTNENGDSIPSARSALKIQGGVVTAQDVFGAERTLIAVGSEKNGSQESSTGSLEITGVLHQNGASLVVDPDYGDKTATVAIRSLDGARTSQNYADVGVFNGDVFVGKNSALGVGVSADNLRGLIAQYQVNGSLVDPADNKGGYGAILYLDGHARINHKYGVTLTADGQTTTLTSLRKLGSLGTDGYALANSIYLGDNSALAVNTESLRNNEAYVRFVNDNNEKAEGSKVYAAGGDILLYGNTFSRTYKIFDEDVAIVDPEKNTSGSGSIDVFSVNGLLQGVLTNESKGEVDLTVNREKAKVVLNGASAPVQETILSYVRGYNGEKDLDATDEKDDTDYLYVYDSNGNKITTKDNESLINNEFLSEVVLGGNGADAEKVARLGIYGGAAQAAIAAGATTYEAVSGRMGVGANGANLTVADNMQGGALWLTPVYKNNDSDGFGSEGVSYGVDMDLFGLALGADYTLPNGVRVGAAFNVGSGDADGDGAGSGVSNDFDYFGFAVYGGYTFGPWSIVADLSYTTVDNDIDVTTSQGKGNASLDSTNFSLGVTGQYQVDVNGLLVTPHAGLRFTQIDFDDYDIKGEGDTEAVASYEADSMSIFSIPVGITISKEFVNGSWNIKPSFDLTLTSNFGDDEMEGTTHWAGIENLATPVASEVLDNFTYGATVGVAAKSGNFSLGFGLNYTGSSNTDEFGLNANARFVF